jgi:hypothetical protein
MIVKVIYDNNTDSGVVSWLFKIPTDKQWKDIRMESMSKYGSDKVGAVNHGRGFIIENESDPLFIEFKKKFPNTTYKIEE